MAHQSEDVEIQDPSSDGVWGDVLRIQEWLPHRWPFLFVDRILTLDKDARRVTGVKNVTATEPFFPGHFPGQPVMPGVLMLEGLAQTGAVLLYQLTPNYREKLIVFAGIDHTRFRRQVFPGDQVLYEVEIYRFRDRSSRMRGRATVQGDLAVEAEFMSYIVDRKPTEAAP
jgi:beta-hydroxyacyl-ACP dehydratase FabZ